MPPRFPLSYLLPITPYQINSMFSTRLPFQLLSQVGYSIPLTCLDNLSIPHHSPRHPSRAHVSSKVLSFNSPSPLFPSNLFRSSTSTLAHAPAIASLKALSNSQPIYQQNFSQYFFSDAWLLFCFVNKAGFLEN